MARQCWDESRHVEISVKLGEWMCTEIGEFNEATFLYEAACATDPILRLCGVNRALEGLAIDVFNTMREFGDISGDPVLEFCEDWMLADEVTHVKIGFGLAPPPDRERPGAPASAALEFSGASDKLFSLGGFRGETDENPIQLAPQSCGGWPALHDRRDRPRSPTHLGPGAGRRPGDDPPVPPRPSEHTFTLTPEAFTLVKSTRRAPRDRRGRWPRPWACRTESHRDRGRRGAPAPA